MCLLHFNVLQTSCGAMLSISSMLHKSNDPHTLVPFSHHRAIDTQSLQASFFSLTPRIKCSHVPLQEMVWIWFGWCVACCLFLSVSVWHHKHCKVNDLKTEQNSETGLCIPQDFCSSQTMQHILVLGHYHGQKQEPTARIFDASSLRKILSEFQELLLAVPLQSQLPHLQDCLVVYFWRGL